MLGSAPLEAVLGSGVTNTDHGAMRMFIHQAADIGLSILFVYPGSKVPADMRTPLARRKDDKAAQEQAQATGRHDWQSVRSPAGLALATSDKAALDRYLKRYIEVFSTWQEYDEPTNSYRGQAVTYSKKRLDAGEIAMTEPAAINLAIEIGGSNLVVVDCDTAAQLDRWFEVAEVPDDKRPAPTILTPGHVGEGDPDDPSTWAHSDGGHFYFTVPDEIIPTLPRHVGAMTWGGENGFAVLWDRRYVLIPPSTRPEGAYEQLGHVYDLPDWLAEAIVDTGKQRIAHAQANHRPSEEGSLGEAIDEWAQTVSWASILEPLGWSPAPRADGCGCAVWTAPGVHANPKSATAHDAGCAAGRYTEVNAPLHLWTDHDAPPFTDDMGEPGWTPTFSKLQAVALVSYGGKIGAAMDALGLAPDLSVEPGLDPKGPDADLDKSGDGDFSMPGQGGSADFGKHEKTLSPYPDDVDAPDPDVFDSKHNGVPRIAPFSHWRDMPPPEFIIEGLLEHSGLSCIIGAPGIGKSTVAIDIACHVATGKRWQGRQTLKTKVLYLPGEGLSGAVQRIKAWESVHQVRLDDDLLLGNGIVLVNAQNEAWGEIAAYIARQDVGLIIFDTFARMSAGLEENSATDVGRAVRRFDKLKELTSAGVCVVHHTGKGDPGAGRGSSALNGALDSELIVRRATWDVSQIADKDGRLPGNPIELWTSKQKNAEQLDQAIPLLMLDVGKVLGGAGMPGEIKAPVITGPNSGVDPMQGDVVLARPLPEPVVETSIRVRAFLDNLPRQGATRAEIVAAVRPDAYALSRVDTTAYWKQRIGEAVDRALRYALIETLTGTPSGARYIPSSATTPDQARALAAAEVNDSD